MVVTQTMRTMKIRSESIEPHGINGLASERNVTLPSEPYVSEGALSAMLERQGYVLSRAEDLSEGRTPKGKKVNPKYLTKDKAAMKAEIDKHSSKKDNDESAYGKWPADYKGRNTKGTKYDTKPSRATKKFKEMYEVHTFSEFSALLEKESWEKSLRDKAKKTGIAYGILKQVYNRGLAAWKTGHRPGAGQHQWAMGRVNSFATGEGGARGADDDLWDKVKKSKSKKNA